jgi:hypothetical protein
MLHLYPWCEVDHINIDFNCMSSGPRSGIGTLQIYIGKQKVYRELVLKYA